MEKKKKSEVLGFFSSQVLKNSKFFIYFYISILSITNQVVHVIYKVNQKLTELSKNLHEFSKIYYYLP